MAERGGFSSFDLQGYSSYHAGSTLSTSGKEHSGECNRLSQVIAANIQKITQNVSQMQRLINQIGTGMDTPELRDKLHQIQHYTNQLAKETNQKLKDLVALPQPTVPSEQKQQKMQRERLMNDFTSVLNNFQAAQRLEKEKEKESVQRARMNSTSFDPFTDERQSQEKLVALDGSNQMQIEEDVNIEVLHEREQAIRQLEADIMDVNQIFKDLGLLIHEQGDMIDSIEASVESAAVSVEHGTQQLQQARNYQSKVRRRKLCILIIVLVILAILAIIIGVVASRQG